MALDLSALRAKLGELKGNTARTEVLWKPKEGENRIRIVPLAITPDNPFTELYFHYLGNKTYLSPISFGDADPIAEFADSLRAGGGLSKEDWKETKKFVPQRRTYVPVIDRNNPEAGVRFWAFGKTVYSDLLAVMADPDFGDITDAQTGRDIKVTFVPQEKSDTSFAKTTIIVSPKQTILTSDAVQLKKWLNEQPDLMALYPKMSYDDLKDVLEKFVNGGTSATPSTRTVTNKTDDNWGDDVSPSAAKARNVTKKPSADIEAQFADAFGSSTK